MVVLWVVVCLFCGVFFARFVGWFLSYFAGCDELLVFDCDLIVMCV